jgi:putative FmdB family regulatory protein
MPIYEFVCQDCRYNLELLALKEGDTVELKCPECGSENLERVLSTVSINTDGVQTHQSPVLENKSCSGGTCSSLTLPGHTKN